MRLEALNRKLDHALLENLNMRAAALRPDVHRDAEGLTELEFVIGMCMELNMIDMDQIKPFIEQFRKLDVDGNGRLAYQDLRVAVIDSELDKGDLLVQLTELARRKAINEQSSKQRRLAMEVPRRGSSAAFNSKGRTSGKVPESPKQKASKKWQGSVKIALENRVTQQRLNELNEESATEDSIDDADRSADYTGQVVFGYMPDNPGGLNDVFRRNGTLASNALRAARPLANLAPGLEVSAHLPAPDAQAIIAASGTVSKSLRMMRPSLTREVPVSAARFGSIGSKVRASSLLSPQKIFPAAASSTTETHSNTGEDRCGMRGRMDPDPLSANGSPSSNGREMTSVIPLTS